MHPHVPIVSDKPAAPHTIVIGAGQAAVQLADSLRSSGDQGSITLVSEELHLPYQRPQLSKEFITSATTPQPLPLRAESFFADRNITLLRGARAVKVDRTACKIELADGSILSYSDLIFATGTRSKTLDIEGSDLAGICYLRTLDDAQQLKEAIVRTRRLVIVGAGFIGLEIAAGARKCGLDVTVLEFAARPMQRVVTSSTADWFTEMHRRQGTDIRTSEGVASFRGQGGRVSAVVSSTGQVYPADLVVVGVGVLPNSELADAAGLDTDDGVMVDAALRTQDRRIWALGDCARYPNTHIGAMARLESVQNAMDQARCVAQNIIAARRGDRQPPSALAVYNRLPWFWSNQGKGRLQIAGLCDPSRVYTATIGNTQDGRFSVLCFDDERLVGVESVNSPADHMAARKILSSGLLLTRQHARDPQFHLKSFASNQSVPA